MKIAHIEWEKKPRTWGKVQKIRDLEGVGLFHPLENTLQMDDVFGGKLNFYFEHRVASILVNKDYTELTLHLLQATFFGFSKTQIPENISR